jgi:hypothetical protein
MKNRTAAYWLVGGAAALAPLVIVAASANEGTVTTSKAAFQDYNQIKTGAFRKITPAGLPEPFATKSSSNGARLVPWPDNAFPKAAEGFQVDLFASGLIDRRAMRTAPTGIFSWRRPAPAAKSRI